MPCGPAPFGSTHTGWSAPTFPSGGSASVGSAGRTASTQSTSTPRRKPSGSSSAAAPEIRSRSAEIAADPGRHRPPSAVKAADRGRHRHPAEVTSGGRVQKLLGQQFSAQPFAVGTGQRPVVVALRAVAGAPAGRPERVRRGDEGEQADAEPVADRRLDQPSVDDTYPGDDGGNAEGEVADDIDAGEELAPLRVRGQQ